VVFEQRAEDVGELDGHLAGQLGLDADERGDGVECVEEEVRVDLALKGVEAGFKKETLLLFQLELDAEGVPDLERDSYDHGRAEPDENLKTPDAGVEREETLWVYARDPLMRDLTEHDEEEHEDLAIDAWLADIAANPAVEAEIDEGGEVPDFFFFDGEAEEAGGEAEDGVEGQGEEFMVVDGGRGEDDAAEHGLDGAEEQAKEDDGFKGDVGGEEVRDGGADPDAEGKGDEEKGHQPDGLAAAAAICEEKPLEGTRAGESRGYGRGDAELDEQRDEQEGVRHWS